MRHPNSQPDAPSGSATYRRAPEQKRIALVEAARDLFSTRGFDATSTLQIAKLAGVSEGTLFHHFGSKRALFDCVAEAFMEAGVAATTSGDIDAITQEHVVRSAFDFADTDPGLYQLLSRFSDFNDSADHESRSDVVVDAIRKRLEEAMTRGLARSGNSEIMARLEFILVDGAYKAWRQTGDPTLREAYITETAISLKAMSEPRPDSRKPE